VAGRRNHRQLAAQQGSGRGGFEGGPQGIEATDCTPSAPSGNRPAIVRRTVGRSCSGHELVNNACALRVHHCTPPPASPHPTGPGQSIMASTPLTTAAGDAHDGHAEACEAWRHAVEHYLQLARHGAAAGKLRAAAAAVHAAALRKGRFAGGSEDPER
jgi:hypothetical protein